MTFSMKRATDLDNKNQFIVNNETTTILQPDVFEYVL